MTSPVTSPRSSLPAFCSQLLLSVLLFACAVPTWAAAIKFDIPAQPAATALPQFIAQADVPMMFNREDLKNVQANAVTGEFEADVALQRLLAGTGFVAKRNGGGKYAVVKEAALVSSIEGSVRDLDSSRPVVGAKLVITGTEKFTFTDKRGRFTLEGVPTGQHEIEITAEGMQHAKITDVMVKPGHTLTLSTINIPAQRPGVVQLERYIVSAKKNDSVVELDPYSVEGHRIRPFARSNLDLTRTENDPLPFVAFSARDIAVSGASDLQEFFQTKLPQNFVAELPAENYSLNPGFIPRDNINLRGWGAAETVVLLNGRRIPPQYQGTSTDKENSLNLQGIPLGSIERIEILPAAGSAIYGVGATGGVINIITKQDFAGGQVTYNYESPADVNRTKQSIELYYASPITKGLSLKFSASYSRSEPLLAGDRKDVTIARWRRLVMERQPTILINQIGSNPLLTSSQPFGATPNIRTVSTAATANLFGGVPGSAASNFTTVPAGSTGALSASAYAPGVYNLATALGASSSSLYADASPLGRYNERTFAGLEVEKQLGDNWRLSTQYNYTETKSWGPSTTALSFTSSSSVSGTPVVPALAPTNPFGQAVRVALVDPRLELENARVPSNVTWELISTLRGSIGSWDAYLDAGYTHGRNSFVTQRFYEPTGGWTSAFLSGRYNPFIDPRVARFADDDFYRDFVIARTVIGNATHNYQTSAKASGPLLKVREQVLTLTAGAEWNRIDRYDNTKIDIEYISSSSGQPVVPASGSRPLPDTEKWRYYTFDTTSGYAELALPLISDNVKIPGLKGFEVHASGRIGNQVQKGYRYLSVGGGAFEASAESHVYSVGFRYDLNDDIAFRASRSVGFKPAGVEELMEFTPLEAGFPADFLLELSDPRRGGEVVQLPITSFAIGGSSSLKPETTTSRNLGLIFTPRRMPGFRLSMDWIESVRNNAITFLSEQQVVDLESQLFGRVTRSSADGHPSGVGPITFVDARLANLNLIRSQSLDISLDYERSNVLGGTLSIGGSATKNLSFEVQADASSSAVEQVRNVNAVFTQALEWNGTAHVRWDGRKWSFGWSTRYFDDLLVNPTNYVVQGSDRADSAFTHDVFAGYRVTGSMDNSSTARRLLDNISVTIGVKNALDREPRFWAASTDRGVAPYDSIMGRTVWVQMRKTF